MGVWGKAHWQAVKDLSRVAEKGSHGCGWRGGTPPGAQGESMVSSGWTWGAGIPCWTLYRCCGPTSKTFKKEGAYLITQRMSSLTWPSNGVLLEPQTGKYQQDRVIGCLGLVGASTCQMFKDMRKQGRAVTGCGGIKAEVNELRDKQDWEKSMTLLHHLEMY